MKILKRWKYYVSDGFGMIASILMTDDKCIMKILKTLVGTNVLRI